MASLRIVVLLGLSWCVSGLKSVINLDDVFTRSSLDDAVPAGASAAATKGEATMESHKAPFPVQWMGTEIEDLFDNMKFSIVRIQSIVASTNWFEPYHSPVHSQMVGSGFAVDLVGLNTSTDDFIFLTNAHVVRDAHTVTVQFPSMGGATFEAFVPLICDDFDLAVVQVKNSAMLKEALRKVQWTMKPLPIQALPLKLGLEVAAVGFPLGSASLKLSRGVISGSENVGGWTCYQTTAPISPGSSGGPLFAMNRENALQIIGVNFASASAAQAQNINFVVATVHIVQVLKQFHKLLPQLAMPEKPVVMLNKKRVQVSNPEAVPPQPQPVPGQPAQPVLPNPGAPVKPPAPPAEGPQRSGDPQVDVLKMAARVDAPKEQVNPPTQTPSSGVSHEDYLRMRQEQQKHHYHMQVAPVAVISIEANDALYTSKCAAGVYVAHVQPHSCLRLAAPAMPEQFFLIAVDDVPLDNFGKGRTEHFLGDPTSFESLMMTRDSIDDLVTLKICSEGNISDHKVNMTWNENAKPGIMAVSEPFWNPQYLDYEIFAGITLMEMTVNHVQGLLQAGSATTLGRWLMPENQMEAHVMITSVEKGTYASRVLAPGMTVRSINGNKVNTLAQLRSLSAFIPADNVWRLETDLGLVFAAMFMESLQEQIMLAKMHGLGHLVQDRSAVAQSFAELVKTGKIVLQQPGVSPPGGSGSLLAQVQTETAVMAGVDASAGDVNSLVAYAAAAEELAREARAKVLEVGGGNLAELGATPGYAVEADASQSEAPINFEQRGFEESDWAAQPAVLTEVMSATVHSSGFSLRGSELGPRLSRAEGPHRAGYDDFGGQSDQRPV